MTLVAHKCLLISIYALQWLFREIERSLTFTFVLAVVGMNSEMTIRGGHVFMDFPTV